MLLGNLIHHAMAGIAKPSIGDFAVVALGRGFEQAFAEVVFDELGNGDFFRVRHSKTPL